MEDNEMILENIPKMVGMIYAKKEVRKYENN